MEAKTVVAKLQQANGLAKRAAEDVRKRLIQSKQAREKSPNIHVIAPADGAVVFLGPIKPGAHVRERQPLFQLTPSVGR